MPFVNYRGVAADSGEAADLLLAAAIRETQTAKGAYLRATARRGACFAELPVQTHKVEMVLPLQRTVGEQWRVLNSRLRDQVRKAEKSGLTVATGGAGGFLDGFYDVLSRNIRTWFPRTSNYGNICQSHTTPLYGVARIHSGRRLVIWHGGTRIEVPSALRAHNALCPMSCSTGKCSSSR